MPKKPPKGLRPYLFHGLDLRWEEEDDNAAGDCPWCDREGKLSVEVDTGKYLCYGCKASGNAYTFLRWLWGVSREQTTVEQYEGLAEDRGLLDAATVMSWGVCRSLLRAEWLVPGFGVQGKAQQLYRYVTAGGRTLLMPTPTLGHRLHGVDLLDREKPVVWVCEGVWDAMTLWEVLRVSRIHEGMLVSASDPSRSLGAETAVLATPAASVWRPEWAELLAGRRVVLAFDSDYPRQNAKTGQQVEPVGYAAVRRVAGLLAGAKKPPAGIQYLRWGPNGYDPDLPSGWDLRDALQGTQRERTGALEGLLGRLTPVAAEALKRQAAVSDSLGPVDCDNARQLRTAWRKALHWTDGLDHALVVMLAAVASTKSVGDQLWVKVIGPAACGKSTLCEALSVSKTYVKAVSTIRGFFSGYRSEEKGAGGQDNSLVPLIRNKTLVTKDGDTLLTSPNLPQILSEGRDLYDGTARTHYRNAMGQEYEGIRVTWLLCGTSSLRSIDSSELGERFLDCVIMEGIDDEMEDEIGWRKAQQARNHALIESDGEATSQYSPELLRAMQLTGGYVEWLREHAVKKLAGIDVSDDALKRCQTLAKFTAYMRARPSVHQEENAERELSSRLVSQLVRLAQFIAVVLNVGEVDDAVMSRVKRVAMDTSRGLTLKLIQHLRESGEGLQPKTAAMLLAKSVHQVHQLLRFLHALGAIRTYRVTRAHGVKGPVLWRLTDTMERLYDEVNPLST